MKPTYEELESELANTKALLKQALERIAELEEKLSLNSSNSSKPPSTDFKANVPERKRKKRAPREGKARAPFAADRVDRWVECTRHDCAHCGSGAIVAVEATIEVLQQVELPKVRAIVTEYLLQKYSCTACGKRSTADLPEGVPDSVFGPRVMALFANLTGVFHLAKREAIQLVKDVYDIDIGLGSSSNIEERVAAALDPVCQRIHRVILGGSLCKHFDETGWRTNGKHRFVWVASTDVAAYYMIDESRSREALERLTGKDTDKLQKVVSDRYGVYNVISRLHQYCLAHLIRNFQRFSEREEKPDKSIGEALAKELAKACQIHGEYREGHITKGSRNMRLGHLKRRVEYWLEDGHANGSDKLSGMCATLLDNFDKLWTFTKVDGMEPTNNLAERDLRKVVIWRKKSNGTRSRRGEVFVERITSVAETLKRHGKNILHYIEQAVRSFYANKASPEICVGVGL